MPIIFHKCLLNTKKIEEILLYIGLIILYPKEESFKESMVGKFKQNKSCISNDIKSFRTRHHFSSLLSSKRNDTQPVQKKMKEFHVKMFSEQKNFNAYFCLQSTSLKICLLFFKGQRFLERKASSKAFVSQDKYHANVWLCFHLNTITASCF